MTPTSNRGLSVWQLAAALTLFLFLLGVGGLTASYRAAHTPRLSDSWDGPLVGEIGSCGGPVHHWLWEVGEHKSGTSTSNPETSSSDTGFVTWFVTVIVPWHVENQPFLLVLFGICEFGVLAGAYQLRHLEKSLWAERKPRPCSAVEPKQIALLREAGCK